jgi:hypothetical protein
MVSKRPSFRSLPVKSPFENSTGELETLPRCSYRTYATSKESLCVGPAIATLKSQNTVLPQALHDKELMKKRAYC